jgi:hypothetical protein
MLVQEGVTRLTQCIFRGLCWGDPAQALMDMGDGSWKSLSPTLTWTFMVAPAVRSSGRAHSGCFTTALSMVLGQSNLTAERLDTKVDVALSVGGLKVPPRASRAGDRYKRWRAMLYQANVRFVRSIQMSNRSSRGR